MKLFAVVAVALSVPCIESCIPAQAAPPPAAASFVVAAHHISCPGIGLNVLAATVEQLPSDRIEVTMTTGARMHVTPGVSCFIEELSQADIDRLRAAAEQVKAAETIEPKAAETMKKK